MKHLRIYVDASVVGGCEDAEFQDDSLGLWQHFVAGRYMMLLSEHALRELAGAPKLVLNRLREIPVSHRVTLVDNNEAVELAEAYLEHGILGPGSRSDALHVALATVAGADVLVSWNFKHIVNLGKIRNFDAVNLQQGYGQIEIRSPKELLIDENQEDI